jgi:hypothetical protein
VLIENIFGGGNQSGSTGQTTPSTGSSSAGETTPTETTIAPSADNGQSDQTENTTPEDVNDGTYGPTPPAEAEDQVEAPSENKAPADTDTDIAPAGPEPEVSDSAPVAEEDAADVVAEAPAEGVQDTRAAASASKGVQDFLTPLLGELDTIRQRQDVDASDAETASHRRAAANVQDQLVRQMLDQITTKSDSRASTQLARSDDAKQAQSLPARWYAEA